MTDVSGAAEAFRQSLHLLATRRFGTFWVSTLLSNIGTWAQQVAEPWLLLSLGASPFLIGLDSFAMNAPVWALTLLARARDEQPAACRGAEEGRAGREAARRERRAAPGPCP